ncbi:hypothetical protein CMI45_00840 [Candidatus Pacearchaeota archaeon]|nr:hypothetical protein [Candidatus Pacearchaeota archaeon]|tara:strand:+ start:110 stop:1564 length:1455 start_codon:yes stop_codon:yes gene_type:complete
MEEIDYSKIGLKAGLEIHQQLDTGKLFSRTPSLLRSDKPDYVVSRRLHAVAGEEGEIDSAVEHEAALDKEFIYEGYDDTISLVELDESPPQSLDQDALEETIKIALLLNCEIYPVSQIMRKTVIDGSNTSGFQRTVLIGHDGFVETSLGKVGIESVALEEDAARIISKDGKETRYRLDRLGIPLVEVATFPDLKNAEHVKETALKLGEILRAGKAKRGIGTIRQDVNISIKGHDRVEIKGFQDPKMMIKTVNLEIERQQKDLKEKKKEGGVRNALSDGITEFLRPIPGRARMYPETDLELLRIGRHDINDAKRNLPKLKSEKRNELKKFGLSEELMNLILADGEMSEEFNILMKVYDGNADLVGKMVSLWRNELTKKSGKKVEEVKQVLGERELEKILEAVKSRDLEEGEVKRVMGDVLSGIEIEEAIKIEKVDDNELEEKIRKLIKEKPGLRENAYMGLVMKEMKGKIDSKKAMELVKKVLEE